MTLRITSRNVVLDERIREFTRRRIHFALGRFTQTIRCVTVRLQDENGTRGGVDKLCVVSVETAAGQRVLVRETQASVAAAVAAAAERAGRAVARMKTRRLACAS